ncbi:MAG TPA: TIM-barrel domain-containing protein [Phycisphaerales bacterium]|nr:TIM-barrel domain-containing protein [Phycisphaerales bacterium]
MRGLNRSALVNGLAYRLVALAGFAAAPHALAQLTAESLSTGAIRFYESPAAREAAFASYAITQDVEKAAKGKVELGSGPKPEFFTTTDDKGVTRHGARIKLPTGTSLYGAGEATGPLLRNGRKITAWNTDAYGYGREAESLYKSHPWVLCVRPDGSAFGVLADTTYRCEMDCAATNSDELVFTSDGPSFPIVIIEGAHPAEVVQGLGKLTGVMPLPAKWTLGYHQCRYSYFPEARAREIAKNFRDRHIPCDVIWYDIDYYESFRCFTFDRGYFPDPKKLNADLLKDGFHNVWMINPGIKSREDSSPAEPPAAERAKEPADLRAAREAEKEKFRRLRDDGLKHDVYVKNAAGKTYEGEVWPGWCYFPDYTSPAVREWWGPWYKPFMDEGVTGVWNDMNEPAVFNVQSKTMPLDNRHAGDPTLIAPSGKPQGDAAAGDHARYHNVYGLMMVKGTREGIQASAPDKRPFVLSRATYIGGQRYHAGWSGDNSATWYHMEDSVPMTLSMGLSGFSFYGPDIGGFAGDGDGELFERWLGFGSLLPFCRGHTGKGNIDKEPWAFGAEVEETSRLALQRRYRLLPYIYTLYQEASTSGLPVVRPLFFVEPANPVLRAEDDAFLLGGDLMIVPQMVPDRTRVAVMPTNFSDWRELSWLPPADAGNTTKGPDNQNPDLPKLFVRPGAIIPTGPVTEFVTQKSIDPLILIVNPAADGTATGALYEDQGDGYAYEKGDYRKTAYMATREGRTLTITSTFEGRRAGVSRTIEVRVLLAGREVVKSFKAGEKLTIDLGK